MGNLAKADGTDMITHTNAVTKVCNILYDETFCRKGKYNDISKEVLILSSKLHDVGKLTKDFQKLLDISPKTPSKQKKFFMHNEVSWAFFLKYFNGDNILREYVSKIIYWHHGIPFWRGVATNTISEILETIDADDIKSMMEFVNSIGLSSYFDFDCDEFIDEKTPLYLESNKSKLTLKSTNNLIFLTVLSMVISGDRIASEFSLNEINNENINTRVNQYLYYDKSKVNEVICKYRNSPLYPIQKEIADNLDKSGIIKAPAGFGKTITGVMAFLNQHKRCVWICPRNTVVESVYLSIIQELNNLNQDKISVELFLTGEVKDSTHPSNGFESDIIVTNIDNYLSASFRNEKMKAMHLFNNGFVVFDEYHEFVNEAALYSGFVNVMLAREHVIQKPTLLLSATPSLIYMDWLTINPFNSLTNMCNVLPDTKTHFRAPHDKKYTIRIFEGFPLNEMKKKTNNTLFKFNSIGNTQEFYRLLNSYDNADKIVHSKYNDSDKERNLKYLLDNYGRNSDDSLVKGNVVASDIVQAALNISFNIGWLSISSPESTLQQIGRIVRFAELVSKGVINLYLMSNDSENYKSESNSENSAIRINYNLELTKLWYSFLLNKVNSIGSNNECEATLSEIYVWYNEFNSLYCDKILAFLKSKLIESNKNLEKMYPVKYFASSKADSEVVTVNSNKLRVTSRSNSIFAIIKNSQSIINKTGKVFTEPIQFQIYCGNVGDEFREGLYASGDMVKHLNNSYHELYDSLNDEERKLYDFEALLPNNQHLKKRNVGHYISMGAKSNTPYVRYDVIYDEELGIIDL